ncbi:hypothetical protein BOX15_Mlig028864g1 [Macrostomum lignano]|uniref:Ubiquitin carboxyl-terminal hydrolase n=1 Tax=Macrostomum lignano TaxID=282301 RepID=A0A267DVU7_9PLAT|nr:hypothetical protein BOX15_Mlig028864g1 [Macrostomum lignano]
MPTSSGASRARPSFSAATDVYARSHALYHTYGQVNGLHRISRPPLPKIHQNSSATRSNSASSSQLRQQQRAKSTSCLNGDSVLLPSRKLPPDPAAAGHHRGANGSNAAASSSSTSAGRSVNGRRRSSVSLHERGMVGLSNLGNTCYMNSMVQCLSHTRPLLELLMRSSSESIDPPPGRLAAAYQRLMRDMWSSSAAAVISPTELRSRLAKFAPRFRGSGQQDSQECLRYLLEGLHEDLSRNSERHPRLPAIDYDQLDRLSDSEKSLVLWQRYTKLENSPIVDIFVGQLKSTLQCCECGHKSTTFDPFWDLALSIPRGNRVSLAACLDLFTDPETLDGNERPKCDKCKTRRRCLKSFCLYRLPTILVIHLKRFSGERYRTKLNTLVDYPFDLDLSEFVDTDLRGKQPAHYSLYAVSEHSGTPMGGHYTAIVRHAYAIDRWVAFSDASVRRSSESAVVSSQGYVLFYERTKRSHTDYN